MYYKDVLNVLERRRVALPMSGLLKNGIAEKNFTESGGCRSGWSPSTYCFIHQEYKLSRCEINPELFFLTRRLMKSCSRPALRSTSRLRWRRREWPERGGRRWASMRWVFKLLDFPGRLDQAMHCRLEQSRTRGCLWRQAWEVLMRANLVLGEGGGAWHQRQYLCKSPC